MSNNLDKKLEELLKALVSDEWHDDGYLPSYKQAIKQAFIDDGWVKLSKAPKYIPKPREPLIDWMTGQEWLSRFFREMRKDSNLIKEDFNGFEENVIAAAKKASELTK